MAEVDWYEIKFLESPSNLKGLVKKSVGKEPSAKIAREISVCLQQGRLFFEAALSSPPQIQPLEIFYGVIGFAKAIVLVRNLVSIDTLVQSHGLTDISQHNAKVEGLTLKVGKKGTFQQFNDAIAPLGRISYYDDTMPKWAAKPFDGSSELTDQVIPIKEIFARIPSIRRSYEKTFGQPAKACSMQLNNRSGELDGYVELRIDDPELFTDRKSLKKLVRKWRQKYPFLEDWCVAQAQVGWGNSILFFCNIDKTDIDEFSDNLLVERGGQFFSNYRTQPSYATLDSLGILSPLSGGITLQHGCAIQPFDGVYLSEYSLQFLGCFLLSSLVRYRPQVWQHAVSRSVSPQSPADDRSLALIERFLDDVLTSYPKLVVHAIDYTRSP